jgi:5-methylcytosine-specific restriction endonuclease McrA
MSADFTKVNGFLFEKFEERLMNRNGAVRDASAVADGIGIDMIEVFRKHLSPNRYHSEKIAFVLNYFRQYPPFRNPLLDNDYLTNEEYFDIYITPCVKDIYNFNKQGSEEQGRSYKAFMTELQDIIRKEEFKKKATATATKDVVMKDVSNVSDDAIETKKKKKKAIPATIKRLVWNTNIGEMIGKSKCLCCNSTDITQMSFNCGHIVAEANGGDTIVSNLKPICQNCNSSMGTKNMDEFMKSLK